MHDHHAGRRPFRPAMGVRALLPIYDIVARLGGARAIYRAVTTAAELRPGMRVLDVGCGTGNLVATAARAHPNVEVIGVDPDERALSRARGKVRRAGLPVRLDHGYAQQLPYPDASFDRVLSSLMLHHLGDAAKAEMLAEVRRVLRPTGHLMLADIAAQTGMHGLLARRLRRTHSHAGDLDTIPELLSAAGFRDVSRIDHIKTRFGPVGLFRAHPSADRPSERAAEARDVTG